ncbi:MAG: GGDEF domain-containing protein, partial [Leptolyngbyaceae bacterium]|nr:GGDEF domain-containing protein [Leptolyngbyaceae bacterium]
GYIQVFDSGVEDLCDFYEWGTIEKGLRHQFNEYSLVVDEHVLGKVFLPKKYIESQALFFPELLATWLHYVAIALRNTEQLEALRLQTITDPLTGLFNRRYMMDILTRLTLSLSETNSVGVMMIDLDHFKAINDTYGHQAGDSVLKDFSCFLRGMVRPTDIVCRYGGEEFALILPRTPLSTVCERAERICRGLSYLTMKHDHQTIGHITVSIGIAVFPDDGLSAAELIQSADRALYRAKSWGRNQVVAASSGVNLKHVRISPA